MAKSLFQKFGFALCCRRMDPTRSWGFFIWPVPFGIGFKASKGIETKLVIEHHKKPGGTEYFLWEEDALGYRQARGGSISGSLDAEFMPVFGEFVRDCILKRGYTKIDFKFI